VWYALLSLGGSKMRNLWSWVAVAAGLYGTVCLGGLLYPGQIRKAGLEVQLPNIQQQSGDRQFEQNGPRSSGRFPEMPRLEKGELPLRLDFKKMPRGTVTFPQSPVDVRSSTDGPGILRWKIVNEQRSYHVLTIPFRLEPGAHVLRLRLRCQPETLVHVDLKEDDGTLYAVERMARPQWLDLKIPLDEFKLARFQRDENERLDSDRIIAFAMLALTPRGEDTSAWQPGAQLEQRIEERREAREGQPPLPREEGPLPPLPVIEISDVRSE